MIKIHTTFWAFKMERGQLFEKYLFSNWYWVKFHIGFLFHRYPQLNWSITIDGQKPPTPVMTALSLQSSGCEKCVLGSSRRSQKLSTCIYGTWHCTGSVRWGSHLNEPRSRRHVGTPLANQDFSSPYIFLWFLLESDHLLVAEFLCRHF
jgi:hypothetical protein